MRWLWIALAAVLIVGLTWWRSTTMGSVPSTAATAEVPVPASAPAVSAGTRGAGVRMHAPVPFVGLPGEVERMAKARHDAARADVAKITAAGRSKLSGQYHSEPVDASWASARQQSLMARATSAQIEDIHVKPDNFAATCRSTTCMITADFPTRAAAEDWFTLFLTNTGTNLSNASSRITANPDGSAHIEIYGLAR